LFARGEQLLRNRLQPAGVRRLNQGRIRFWSLPTRRCTPVPNDLHDSCGNRTDPIDFNVAGALQLNDPQ
jgi:hypothetical protein